MASLAEIRARIAAQEAKKQNKGQTTPSDNSIYPHWNIDAGATATVRFLPDGLATNPDFWVERLLIKLPFNGIKGDAAAKQITVQVPCVEMYGMTCPVISEIRPWYKDESLKELANKYWKKRSYIFQGFVRVNPLGDDKTPANPIRKFIISPQIIPIVKAGLMDPEILELPTDYMRGLDFNIKKTTKGEYADYSTSGWARRESPLTEAEQAAIAAHGLFNLATFLPKKPGEAEMNVIKEMFDASVNGESYDPERWGAYYRPFGVNAPAGAAAPVAAEEATVQPAAATPATPVKAEVKAPVKTAADKDKTQDILAMIRNRQPAKAA
jgi:hypothetical protein